MKINPTVHGLYNASLQKAGKVTGSRQLSAEERAEAVAAEKTDRLSISSQGSLQRDVGRIVRGIMQDIREYDAGALTQRAEFLAQAVEEGSYQVDANDLAAAILGRAYGDTTL